MQVHSERIQDVQRVRQVPQVCKRAAKPGNHDMITTVGRKEDAVPPPS
jgi:hypothetical protein